MYWRRRLFFWLIKIQARHPLVPRLTYREITTRSRPEMSESVGEKEAMAENIRRI